MAAKSTTVQASTGQVGLDAHLLRLAWSCWSWSSTRPSVTATMSSCRQAAGEYPTLRACASSTAPPHLQSGSSLHVLSAGGGWTLALCGRSDILAPAFTAMSTACYRQLWPCLVQHGRRACKCRAAFTSDKQRSRREHVPSRAQPGWVPCLICMETAGRRDLQLGPLWRCRRRLHPAGLRTRHGSLLAGLHSQPVTLRWPCS